MIGTELALEFAGEDWQRVEQRLIAWYAQDVKRPLLMIEGFVSSSATSPTNVRTLDSPVAQYRVEQPAGEILSY